MAALRYISTRGQASPATLSQAIAAGLAPDGGLYVPENLPQLDAPRLASGPLPATATALLAPFFSGDPLSSALSTICTQAFTFEAPLKPLPYTNAHVLELFHGPTAAFKDFGARFLATCMRHLRLDGMQTVLVATSGDTGAAVGAAFHRQPGTQVVILYPDGHVAPRQAHQLGSFGDNVHTLRVDGFFDDCQRMVKSLLHDSELQTRYGLTSANSISLGRLLPQMSYYAQAAIKWWHEHHEKLNFIIPAGNLGNSLACLWAQQIGLPIGEVRLACNANATVPEYFAGNEYTPRPAVPTLANAMDIGAPSNFERLRWTFPDEDDLRKRIHAYQVEDPAIRDTITRHWREHHEVFCPHTATAVNVLDQLRAEGDDRHWTVVSTAHPAKFDEVVEPLIGEPVPVPPTLGAMLDKPSEAEPIAASEEDLRHWLEKLPHA